MNVIFRGMMPAIGMILILSNGLPLMAQEAQKSASQDPYFNPAAQPELSTKILSKPQTDSRSITAAHSPKANSTRKLSHTSSIIREGSSPRNAAMEVRNSTSEVGALHGTKRTTRKVVETDLNPVEPTPRFPPTKKLQSAAEQLTTPPTDRPSEGPENDNRFQPMSRNTASSTTKLATQKTEHQLSAQERAARDGTGATTGILPPKRTPVSKASPRPDQPEGSSFEPGRVVAIVGGEPIFVGDILYEANSMIERVMAKAPKSIKDQQRPLLIKRLVPKFVDAKLLYMSTIAELPDGVDLDAVLEQADSEFDEKALPVLMEKSGVKSPMELDAHLRGLGSSLRNMRRSWSKEQLTRYFLAQQLQVNTEVTHQEMLEHYRQHESEFWNPARVRWEQVMVRFSKFPSRSKAKRALVELGNQIVYGAKLEAVAKKSSHGFRAHDGGQHDWTTQGALVAKELDRALFRLPVGELSEIIETRDGFHIVRVIERTPARATPFLEAQVDIKKKLEAEKREKAFEEHLMKIRKEIPYEIFDEAIAPESAQSST